MNDIKRQSALHYDEFFGPIYFEPFAIEVASRIAPAAVKVALEIAAGTGRVTRHIRNRIPSTAKLIASDIDDNMLSITKEKLNDLDVDWKKIDAQQLPFEDDSIDLVVCCFGYMFMPDKSKAFSEAYRVLKSGGILSFTTWDSLENNGASDTFLSVAEKFIDGKLPSSTYVATSMSDGSIIRPLLEHAGFSDIVIEKVTRQSACNSAKDAARGFAVDGPITDQIRKRNTAGVVEFVVALEQQFSEKFGDAPMIIPISAWIVQARK